MSRPPRRSFVKRSRANSAARRQSRWTATRHHRAVRELKADGSLPADAKLRSSRYLNNLIEQDHRGVKQRIAVMLGFKGFRNAAVTNARTARLQPRPHGQRRIG